jgi:GPH family glycoside/pentoside/hexuronide:cation symporter
MKQVSPHTPLPRSIVLGYGVGELGIAGVEFFLRVYLVVYAVEGLGIPGSVAGIVLAVAVVWDAVTDPLMGEISDLTTHAVGRRRLWIGVGGPAAAGAFAALFLIPAAGSETVWKALHLLGLYLVCNTALTVLSVPHSALGGELTSVPDQRNRVFGWRFLFANLGLLAAVVIPAVVPGGGTSGPWAVLLMGGLVIATSWLCYRATRGWDVPSKTPGVPVGRHLVASVSRALRAGPFRPLIAAFMVGSIGLTLNSSLAMFFYLHRLQLTEQQVLIGILLPFAAVIAVSIAGWVRIARRWGRRATAFTGIFGLGIGTMIVYPLMPPGVVLWPVAWGVVGGILVGSVFLLDATVADVVDWDEAVSGEHREGVYFGLWRMAGKMARALGLGVSGLVLDAIAFDADVVVHGELTRTGLALAFGPLVGAFLVVAALLWLRVPLNEATQRRINRIVGWRRTRSQRAATV